MKLHQTAFLLITTSEMQTKWDNFCFTSLLYSIEATYAFLNYGLFYGFKNTKLKMEVLAFLTKFTYPLTFCWY